MLQNTGQSAMSYHCLHTALSETEWHDNGGMEPILHTL